MRTKHDVFQQLRESGVVAVLRGVDADTLIEITDALLAGGVTGIELTADTPGIADMVDELDGAFGDEIAIGVGTALDSETARTVMLSGADFVVSPSLHEDVIDTCNRYGTLVAPGIMTPTEAIDAYEAGADALKVFPASTLGPGHIASLKGPLEHLPLLPTGGVSLDNVEAFVEAGADGVGVGSSLVDSEAVAAGDYDVLTERASAFRDAIERARE